MTVSALRPGAEPDGLAAAPAMSSATAAAPEADQAPDWITLGRRSLEVPGLLPVTIDCVLIHPRQGIALVDMTGRPAAQTFIAAVRQRLRDAGFLRRFGTAPPIRCLAAPPSGVADLRPMLDAAFAALPPVALPGGAAWVEAARIALTDAPLPETGPPRGIASTRLLVGCWAVALLCFAGGAISLQRLGPLADPVPAGSIAATGQAALAAEGDPPGCATPGDPGCSALRRAVGAAHASGADGRALGAETALPADAADAGFPRGEAPGSTLPAVAGAVPKVPGQAATGTEKQRGPGEAARPAAAAQIEMPQAPAGRLDVWEGVAPARTEAVPTDAAQPGPPAQIAASTPAEDPSTPAAGTSRDAPGEAFGASQEAPRPMPEAPATQSGESSGPQAGTTAALPAASMAATEGPTPAPAEAPVAAAEGDLPRPADTARSEPPYLPPEPSAYRPADQPAPAEPGLAAAPDADPAAPASPPEPGSGPAQAPSATAGRDPGLAEGAAQAAPSRAGPGDPPAQATLSAETRALLLRRGEAMLRAGDITAARLLLARAAAAGSGAAARRLGTTYDPATLPLLPASGLQPDPEMAATWYRRAIALDDREAAERLAALGTAARR